MRTMRLLLLLVFSLPTLLTAQERPAQGVDRAAVTFPHDAILLPTPWSPWFIGLYAGPDYTIHRGNFQLYEEGILCCQFEEGTGLGYTVGLKTFFPLAERSYLSPRVAWTRHAGDFSARSEPFPFRGLNDSVELMTFDETLSTPIPAFAADLLYIYRLDSATGFYVGAGPSAEYLIETRFTKSEAITGPPGLTYLDGTTERVQEVDFEQEANRFVFGGRFGAGLLYPLSESIRLNPELLLSLPISVVSGEWRMFEIQATLGVLIGF